MLLPTILSDVVLLKAFWGVFLSKTKTIHQSSEMNQGLEVEDKSHWRLKNNWAWVIPKPNPGQEESHWRLRNDTQRGCYASLSQSQPQPNPNPGQEESN